MTATKLASAALIAAATVHCAWAQTKISGTFTQSTNTAATPKTPTIELGGSTEAGPIGPKSFKTSGPVAAAAATTGAPLNLNDQLDQLIAEWPYGLRLVSQANNNVVATGSDGRVRVWANNGGKDQAWRFVKDGSRYRLMNLQNDQFACIAWNGWYWRNTDNIATFTLAPGTTPATKAFRLQENTKSEYFSVGSDGGMVRWAATNQATQEFGLQMLTLKGTTRHQEGNFDTAMKQVTASSDGTEVWGLDNEGSPMRLTLSGSNVTWTVMKSSVPIRQVAVGSASNVWAISSDGRVFRLNNTAWELMPGVLSQISAAADGTVVGVNAADEIFRFENNNWTRLPGLLRSVSAGSAQNIWGVNAAGQVYRWTGSTWQFVNGALMTEVGEVSFRNIRSVSVSRNGLVVGIDSAQRAFHWTGTAWLVLNGSRDKVLGAQALDVNIMPNALVGAEGNIWALATDGKPFLMAYKR